MIFEDDIMHVLTRYNTSIHLYSIKDDLKHIKAHKYKSDTYYGFSQSCDFIICGNFYVVLKIIYILLIDKITGTIIDSKSTLYFDLTNKCLFVIDNIIYVYQNDSYSDYRLLMYQIKGKKLKHTRSLKLLTDKMIVPKYHINVIDSKFYITNKKDQKKLEMYVVDKNGEQINEVNHTLSEPIPIHNDKSPIQKVLIIDDMICILGYNKIFIYV